MRIVMTSLAVLALMACQQSAEPANDMNAVEENVAADENVVDANMAMPAAFQINETSWEFTRDGKATTESIDSNGNYVAWSGDEHIDHGTVAMKDGKACFDSAMDEEGPECWTTAETAIGDSYETTSDKGEKLTVRRIAYVAAPTP